MSTRMMLSSPSANEHKDDAEKSGVPMSTRMVLSSQECQ